MQNRFEYVVTVSFNRVRGKWWMALTVTDTLHHKVGVRVRVWSMLTSSHFLAYFFFVALPSGFQYPHS